MKRRSRLSRLFESHEVRVIRDAEERWTARNESQPQVCHCGQPGRVQVFSHGQVGGVPPMWWRCSPHADVPLECHWHSSKGGPFIPAMVVSKQRRPDGFFDVETREPTEQELAEHPWYYHLRGTS